MRGRILYGESLHGWIALQQWAHLRRHFWKHAIVILFDVGPRVPKRRAAELAVVWIECFDVVNETRLRLHQRQHAVIEKLPKLRDLGGLNGAGYDASDHRYLRKRMVGARREGRGSMGGGPERSVPPGNAEVKKRKEKALRNRHPLTAKEADAIVPEHLAT